MSAFAHGVTCALANGERAGAERGLAAAEAGRLRGADGRGGGAAVRDGTGTGTGARPVLGELGILGPGGWRGARAGGFLWCGVCGVSELRGQGVPGPWRMLRRVGRASPAG